MPSDYYGTSYCKGKACSEGERHPSGLCDKHEIQRLRTDRDALSVLLDRVAFSIGAARETSNGMEFPDPDTLPDAVSEALDEARKWADRWRLVAHDGNPEGSPLPPHPWERGDHEEGSTAASDARHIAHVDPEMAQEVLALLAVLDRVRGTDTDMVEGAFSRSEIGLRIDAVRDRIDEETND